MNNDTVFSSFNYILTRAGYDRVLSTYGTYTCFAPDNKAVKEYINSLYDDEENKVFPHNGMTSKSLEGLSDSLCEDIALFHLCGTKVTATDIIAGGRNITNMLGRQIMTSISGGKARLNGVAAITMPDYEVINGIVHTIDHVVTRSNRLVTDEIEKSGRFSIFLEALRLTGLKDSLTATYKNRQLNIPASESGYYTPTTCKVGYTVFAEPDAVFETKGIRNIEDLIDSARVWYGKSAAHPQNSTQGWYDYYRNNQVKVSPGTDYTEANNVLNMFVRYHILRFSLPENVLAFDMNVWNGNGYNGDSYDYYETMLPKTLVKTWKLKIQGKTVLNRYVDNNTLTDGIETMGSEAMHKVRFDGVEIERNAVLQSLNGYIYPINDVLLYNSRVPDGVLNERMRFDALSLLPETMTNGFRGAYMSEVKAMNSGKHTTRVRFPIDYFENVVVYNGNNTKIDMNLVADKGNSSYPKYKGDDFQGMGVYDFAIKLPPVPDGLYELRVSIDLMMHGSMLQFYIGTGTDPNNMEPIGIPVDMRMSGADDPRVMSIGYVDINDKDKNPEAYADRGLLTDKVMRAHGYMRGPASAVRYPESENYVLRFRAYQFRRILKEANFRQQDYWLRLKTVLPMMTGTEKFSIDFIEFVPVNVYNNNRYLEDMY